jgi:hypothetical protein
MFTGAVAEPSAFEAVMLKVAVAFTSVGVPLRIPVVLFK